MSKAGARPTGGRGAPAPGQSDSAGPAAVHSAPASGQSASAGPAAAQPASAQSAVPAEAGDQSAGGREPWSGWESLIRVGGLVVAIVFAFVSAVVELLLTTLRAGDLVSVWRGDPIGSGGGPLLGLSVLLAIAGNLAIAWFAVGTTGRRWALGPPWALWTIVMLVASGVRTHEGDYLLAGTNYVALAMILIGSLTFAIYTYRMILKRVVPPPKSTSGRD
jgi:hypothetical protein